MNEKKTAIASLNMRNTYANVLFLSVLLPFYTRLLLVCCQMIHRATIE